MRFKLSEETKELDQSIAEALETIQQILSKRVEEENSQEDTINNVSEKVYDINNTVDHLKDVQEKLLTRKIKPVTKYKSEQETNDSLYNQCIGILDETLSIVDGIFPEYQYMDSSITHFSPEGNILNGVIRIAVQLDDFFRNRRYRFEVPMYILDGYVYEPQTFSYDHEIYKFSEEGIKKLVGSREQSTEYYESLATQGTSWASMHKNSADVDEKIPFKEDEKVYKTFPKEDKFIDQKPRSWHIFNKPDMAPSMVENMTSPPTYYNQFDYSLLYS